MSIEKCSSAILKHEAKPYTMIFNEVIQKTRNPFATFIWIYLQSLPEDWVVNYSHLKKHFKIGDDKLKQSIRWLEKSGLLLRVRPRLPNGLFGPMEIQVKNGLKFTQDESSTSRGVIHQMDQPPGGEHPPLTNTIDIKKEKDIKASAVDKSLHDNISSILESEYSPAQINAMSQEQRKTILNEIGFYEKSRSVVDQSFIKKHGITDEMLGDFYKILYTKRKPLTITGWQSLQSELVKCIGEGRASSVAEAFRFMVVNGWTHIFPSYYQAKRGTANQKPAGIMALNHV